MLGVFVVCFFVLELELGDIVRGQVLGVFMVCVFDLELELGDIALLLVHGRRLR